MRLSGFKLTIPLKFVVRGALRRKNHKARREKQPHDHDEAVTRRQFSDRNEVLRQEHTLV